MSINWFPGHMATARREIRKAMPEVDLVFEVLDARIPFSSENPLVAELRGDKPFVQILNKADLADPVVTAAWLASTAAPGVHRLAHTRLQTGLNRKLIGLAHSLVAPNRTRFRPLMAMILGIPNVGKSTLINGLAGRSIAKTGDKPAVTQIQQRVRVGPDLMLLDTPGFLWPKLSPPICGYRLAAVGSISDRVLDIEDLAVFVARFLMERYPAALAKHYGLETLRAEVEEVLDAIGARRGYLLREGKVDAHKVAERLLRDLRDGSFGPVSLETPEDWSQAATNPGEST